MNEHGNIWNMLEERLDKIENNQNIIKTDVAVIRDRQMGVLNELKDIKCTVYGNGKSGLVTQMALIWQKVAIYVALISGGISILVAMIIAYGKGK